MDPSLTVVVLSVVEKKPTVISTTSPESRALPVSVYVSSVLRGSRPTESAPLLVILNLTVDRDLKDGLALATTAPLGVRVVLAQAR